MPNLGFAALIRNVTTRMACLDTGAHHLPVSINDGGEPTGNSYVVSPLTAYGAYVDFELLSMGRPWLTWPLRGLLSVITRQLERADIDRVVLVNNWLLSTSLYPPDWQGEDLPEITRLLSGDFPDHAIGFRSLNRFSNATLIDRLTELGYISIPSRQVYLFDARNGQSSAFLRQRNCCSDAALLRRTPYSLVPGEQLEAADYPRLEYLYRLLYIDKYCPFNPQYTGEWLRLGQEEGWLQLTALRSPAGTLDAVLGWFANDEILSAPVLGYDTGLPQSLGLYRLLSRLCVQEAVNRRCLLNYSSGAADFKRLRGGQPEIEYAMVYVGHLSARRQRIWRRLGAILQAIGVPLMRKFKL